MNDKEYQFGNDEIALFGNDTSPEALESYMNDNFNSETQASIIGLLALTFA